MRLCGQFSFVCVHQVRRWQNDQMFTFCIVIDIRWLFVQKSDMVHWFIFLRPQCTRWEEIHSGQKVVSWGSTCSDRVPRHVLSSYILFAVHLDLKASNLTTPTDCATSRRANNSLCLSVRPNDLKFDGSQIVRRILGETWRLSVGIISALLLLAGL